MSGVTTLHGNPAFAINHIADPNVPESMGPAQAYFEVVGPDNQTNIRLVYNTVVLKAPTLPRLQHLYSEKMDNFRKELLLRSMTPILWWRSRPGVTYDAATDLYYVRFRLTSSPEIPIGQFKTIFGIMADIS